MISQYPGKIILYKKTKYNGVLVNKSLQQLYMIPQAGKWDAMLKQWSKELVPKVNIVWLGLLNSQKEVYEIETPKNETVYGEPIYAIDITDSPELDPSLENEDLSWYNNYGDIINLSNYEASIFSFGNIFIDYFQKHKFCAKCGSKVQLADAGSRLECLNEKCDVKSGNNLLYPRVDPVVIIALYNSKGQVLLGHNKRRTSNKFMISCFSGFMEPGESFEQSCQREVYEETGIKIDIKDIKIIESQPWPFPANLMVGCIGYIRDHETATLRMDLDDELDFIKWVNKEEVENGGAKFTEDELKITNGKYEGWVLPPRTSIAGNLIRYVVNKRSDETKL